MKKICLMMILQSFIVAGALAQFTVSANNRYLLKDGKPFFWMGDTGWELFHRLTLDEASQYLKRRAEQGYTVIQAVALAELDGLETPNANGDKPLINNDPAQPNEAYFKHVDNIIDKAAGYNINIGLLPTWADKIYKDKWGKGPEIFNATNAKQYGLWIGNRYKNKTNIIWIMGGDRNPRNAADEAIYSAMAQGIIDATNGKAMISFHPPGGRGSSEWFHNSKWLGFNMFQTGHCRDNAVYEQITAAYNLRPVKPVMDAEPIYEDHPVCFNAKDLGTSSAYDVRKSAYLDLFAGAFGHTYGCHDIWQFYSPKQEGINGPHIYWPQAVELPGANQMLFVNKLMQSHPITERVPDQTLIKENNYLPAYRIQATRGNDYLFIYTAAGKPFTVVLGKIKGAMLKAYWYDPRNGKTTAMGTIKNLGTKYCTPPSTGYGNDWVLVMDDAAKDYTISAQAVN